MEIMLADKLANTAGMGVIRPPKLQKIVAEADDFRRQVAALNNLKVKELELRRSKSYDPDTDYMKLEKSLADMRLQSRAEANAYEEEIIRLKDVLNDRDGKQEKCDKLRSKDSEL